MWKFYKGIEISDCTWIKACESKMMPLKVYLTSNKEDKDTWVFFSYNLYEVPHIFVDRYSYKEGLFY